ncbi:aspartyl-phosphate phosphatase Spo0E family protein [Halobacillus sp. Marseille-Q1614]|uniref:aspartyl-phosphate phosphatase Spo0E family protein n=1 Tax=Halobacillus sp. Marseille-Q1614 TaxID=2709134 RepID=UPI001571155D|nr:aspartyl-phosphate phosphatase Spo0E family protein [Halobacillus sp. Marseille-Q1614]
MSHLENLEKGIESLREKMYGCYMKNPNDPELVKISQELDDLLNELETFFLQNDH